jgi:hypothetical protein
VLKGFLQRWVQAESWFLIGASRRFGMTKIQGIQSACWWLVCATVDVKIEVA